MNSWVTSSWRDFLLLGLWRSSWPVLWLHEHSQLGSQTTSMLAWHAAWLRKSKAWPACLPRTRLVTQPWEWKSWKSLVFKKKKTRPGNWVWGLSCSTATLLTVAPGPIEVILLIFAMKMKNPNAVFMNRGNHEMLEANMIYGFAGETGAKYDLDLFNLFSESFRNLPLLHLINNEVLVVHAGIPGPRPRVWLPGQTHDPEDAVPVNARATTLAEIASVDRYTELTPNSYKEAVDSAPRTEEKWETDSRMIIDFLWSDPRGGAGYGPSYRKSRGVFMFGPDVTAQFCRENNISLVIRSHEVKAEGWLKDHDTLMSVFSAPNYLDTGGNKGAFLTLTPGPNGKLQAGWCLYVKYYNVYVFNCMNMMNNL